VFGGFGLAVLFGLPIGLLIAVQTSAGGGIRL
jgi:ABC-type antimicrobial peptide transport system permease subunit